jgi:hypothetical protein
MIFAVLLACLAAYAGLALIALAQLSNRQRVYGRSVPRLAAGAARRRRIAGTALLIAAVAIVLAQSGASFGVPLAVLLVSGAAYGVMATLAWAPGLFRFRRNAA